MVLEYQPLTITKEDYAEKQETETVVFGACGSMYKNKNEKGTGRTEAEICRMLNLYSTRKK